MVFFGENEPAVRDTLVGCEIADREIVSDTGLLEDDCLIYGIGRGVDMQFDL